MIKKTTFYVVGMHCASCEILIKDKLSEEKNIKTVKSNFRAQKVEIEYIGRLEREKLNDKIRPFGYCLLSNKEKIVKESLSKKFFDIAAITIIIFIVYFFAQELKIVPDFNAASNLSLFSVFILGLIASTSTCMATSGALFLATVGKFGTEYSTLNTEKVRRLFPAIFFNIGRILSYGFFGLVAGVVGKTISFNFQLGPLLTLFVSLMMILIGLDMLKIFSLSWILPTTFTGKIFEKLEQLLIKDPKKTTFFLGAITYFLPCGFTQTVQVYALGLADPIKSALIMMVFALGTVPALISLGTISSFTQSSFYPVFSKVVAVLIVLIGISYFGNSLALYGVVPNFSLTTKVNQQVVDPNVAIKEGFQVVKMNVNSSGYSPNNFTVKKGIPVKWLINGENVFGCQGSLVSRQLGIRRTLQPGENIIEFTPKEEGSIAFSCAMGMFRGSFNVVGG